MHACALLRLLDTSNRSSYTSFIIVPWGLCLVLRMVMTHKPQGIRRATQTLIDASKEVGLEVKVGKTK
jgi:hypothetical protein